MLEQIITALGVPFPELILFILTCILCVSIALGFRIFLMMCLLGYGVAWVGFSLWGFDTQSASILFFIALVLIALSMLMPDSGGGKLA